MKKSIGQVWIGVALFLLVSGAGQVHAGPYDTWRKQVKIRFALPLQEPMTDFPVLVKLSPAITGFNYADFASPADGADLRFTDASGTLELDYEIENWDPAGVSAVWVKIPSIASTSDCVYAAWGKLGAEAAPSTTNGAVWSPTDRAVYHLNETTGAATARDSTAFRQDATITGTARLEAGVVAGAQSFTDSSTYLTGPATLAGYGVSGAFTLMTWAKSSAASGWQCLLSDGNHYADAYGYLFLSSPDVVAYRMMTAQGGGIEANVSGIGLGEWHCLVQRFNGSSVDLLVDGVLKCSLTIYGTILTGSRNLLIGRRGDGYGLQGAMDELRISSVALSDAWLSACWLTQASNANFVVFSDVLSTATGSVIMIQ